MAHNIPSTLKLSPCPWGDDPALARIMAVLNGTSEDPSRVLTRLVGGAVRNAVMGRPVKQTDYDLATILTPEQVTGRASDAGLKVVPTGIDHGTVTVVVDGRGFEVTTLRADITTDGRRATVAFTDDWRVDATRRDFTLNTLYADRDGAVYDPLGSGVDDARAGRVRFVGDPSARIAEDYLRILRFFRFHALYGTGDMDRDGVAACFALASKIHTLSRERVTAELLKWLGADHPVPTLRIAHHRGILRHVIPAAFQDDVMDRLVSLQKQAGAVDVMPRLMVLLDGYDPGPLLRLSRLQERCLKTLEQMVLEPEGTDASFRRDIYRYGYDMVLQRVLLDLAVHPNGQEDRVLSEILSLKNWPVPRFAVTGANLIAKGDVPGPVFGAKLKAMEEAWVLNDFQMPEQTM